MFACGFSFIRTKRTMKRKIQRSTPIRLWLHPFERIQPLMYQSINGALYFAIEKCFFYEKKNITFDGKKMLFFLSIHRRVHLPWSM